MTVCFCGHSKLYGKHDSIKQKCFVVVREQISAGADSFLMGDYGDFDGLAAAVCLTLKKNILKPTLALSFPITALTSTIIQSNDMTGLTVLSFHPWKMSHIVCALSRQMSIWLPRPIL